MPELSNPLWFGMEVVLPSILGDVVELVVRSDTLEGKTGSYLRQMLDQVFHCPVPSTVPSHFSVVPGTMDSSSPDIGLAGGLCRSQGRKTEGILLELIYVQLCGQRVGVAAG